jgi:hypothetical protein
MPWKGPEGAKDEKVNILGEADPSSSLAPRKRAFVF